MYLNELDKEKYIIDKEKLDNEEARAILAQYIESVIRKALNYVRDKAKEDNEKLLKQIEACNKIVYILSEVSNEDDIKKYIDLWYAEHGNCGARFIDFLTTCLIDKVVDELRKRFGTTAIMRAMSKAEGGTAINRATLVGGHNGGNSYDG